MQNKTIVSIIAFLVAFLSSFMIFSTNTGQKTLAKMLDAPAVSGKSSSLHTENITKALDPGFCYYPGSCGSGGYFINCWNWGCDASPEVCMVMVCYQTGDAPKGCCSPCP